MFDFEKNALKIEDLDESLTEWWIDGFLVKESITLYYGKPSTGKTWLSLGLLKMLSNQNAKLFYLDFDNPKRQIKDRGVDKLLLHSSIKYFSKGSLKVLAEEFLESIRVGAVGKRYKDCIFFFDSTRDFVDIHNTKQVRKFMELCKDIREAGGTVILLHHSTKNGKVIDGSGDFAKSADNVYAITQRAKTENEIQFSLKVENDRDPIANCGYKVNTKTLDLSEIDEEIAMMSEDEEEFVKKGKEILSKNPKGISKTNFLDKLGFKKDDKTARDLLDVFTDKFWKIEKINNRLFNYKLI